MLMWRSSGPQAPEQDGSLQRSCWKFPSPSRAWLENLGITRCLPNHPRCRVITVAGNTTTSVTSISLSGACMLVRREAYDQVGGFDEGFFMYSEETDWQRRMKNKGFRIVFTPAAQVTHLVEPVGLGKSQDQSALF
jgi:GT2 family glycosyltransferase